MKSERRKTKYCLIAMAALLLALLAQPALADKGASNTHQFYVPGEFKGTGGLFKANNFGWYSLTKYNITGGGGGKLVPDPGPNAVPLLPSVLLLGSGLLGLGALGWRRKKDNGLISSSPIRKTKAGSTLNPAFFCKLPGTFR